MNNKLILAAMMLTYNNHNTIEQYILSDTNKKRVVEMGIKFM